ncbi:exonuclease domain-containing protein [Streptomyces sp. NPDC056401]|uniref:3'-5' exonuclease n=1 Tax=Streptomyces sp. NPDC056401 TaxID=3345809 RepID=UPI0035DC70CC
MNFATWPERFLVVDVEGNGATPPDLVEIAAIPVQAGLPVPAEAKSTLIRPPVSISYMATRVHGITNRDVESSPRWPDIADAIRADLDGAWIAAHNASVEYRVLTRHLPGWEPAGVIDTLRLSRATLPGLSGYGLDALIDHTGLNLAAVPGQRHRAGFDAHATALLLLNLAAHYPTWEALAKAAVPPGMPGHIEPIREETLW